MNFSTYLLSGVVLQKVKISGYSQAWISKTWLYPAFSIVGQLYMKWYEIRKYVDRLSTYMNFSWFLLWSVVLQKVLMCCQS